MSGPATRHSGEEATRRRTVSRRWPTPAPRSRRRTPPRNSKGHAARTPRAHRDDPGPAEKLAGSQDLLRALQGNAPRGSLTTRALPRRRRPRRAGALEVAVAPTAVRYDGGRRGRGGRELADQAAAVLVDAVGRHVADSRPGQLPELVAVPGRPDEGPCGEGSRHVGAAQGPITGPDVNLPRLRLEVGSFGRGR